MFDFQSRVWCEKASADGIYSLGHVLFDKKIKSGLAWLGLVVDKP